jgi:hypothetical protein
MFFGIPAATHYTKTYWPYMVAFQLQQIPSIKQSAYKRKNAKGRRERGILD